MKQIFEPITIRDIVQVANWKEVVRAKRYYYPSDKNDYTPVFEYLKKCKYVRPKNENEYIEVVIGGLREAVLKQKEECIGEQFYVIHTNLYSMSFRKWAELASLPISEETIKHYKIEEILAMFIWEITFYGTEKDAAKEFKKINKCVAEIKKDERNSLKRVSKASPR